MEAVRFFENLVSTYESLGRHNQKDNTVIYTTARIKNLTDTLSLRRKFISDN